MEKRVTERRETESHVLYEPPEPLFSTPANIRRIRIIRAVFALSCFALAVIICIFAAVRISAAISDGTEDSGGESASGYGSESATKTEKETDTGKETDNGGFIPILTEETGGGKVEESETVTHGTQTTPEETSTAVNGDTPIVEMDISRTTEKDLHVMNYSDKSIDVDGLLDRGFIYTEKRGDPAPVVLIIHTHTSEEYHKCEDGGFRGLESVVSVGETIASKLNAAGLSTVHCTIIHDSDDTTNAYVKARESIELMQMIYPTIKYVIDVHRMAQTDGEAVVRTVSAVGTAQMRITVSADGRAGQNWQDSLSLALLLRERLNSGGKALCAPTVISASRYNGDVCRYYLMLDVGSLGNTTPEAKKAGEYFADALIGILLPH